MKFSPLLLRDLASDPFSSMFLLKTYAMQLPALSVSFLEMMSKFTDALFLVRSAIYFSLILTLYKVIALLTV
jgi:hypothetical protein